MVQILQWDYQCAHNIFFQNSSIIHSRIYGLQWRTGNFTGWL